MNTLYNYNQEYIVSHIKKLLNKTKLRALKINLSHILPNYHEHISRLICTGGSCTGNSIIHSLTKGHKGINAVLFELDDNLLERSLL